MKSTRVSFEMGQLDIVELKEQCRVLVLSETVFAWE